MREMLDTSLRQQVFITYHNKCYVCSYPLKLALRIHHIVPVHLGGEDTLDNLVLLCANCHTLTHAYSSKRYRESDIRPYVRDVLTGDAATRLIQLTIKIHSARKAVEDNRGLWSENTGITRGAYELEEAVEMVAQKNKFAIEQRDLLTDTLDLIIENIPAATVHRCSFRLLKGGRYISINIMNYLLFRTPAYRDLGGNPHYDCYVIFPKDIDVAQFIEHVQEREVFSFKDFNCINLGLFFDEVLSLTDDDWQAFGNACLLAANAKRSREWVSNIKI